MTSDIVIALHPHSLVENEHIPCPPILNELYNINDTVKYNYSKNEYYILGYKHKIIFEWVYFKNKKLTVDDDNFYKKKVYKLFYNKYDKLDCYTYNLCKFVNCYCDNPCTYIHLNKTIKKKRKFVEELESECDFYLKNYRKIKRENKELKLKLNNKKLKTIKEEPEYY